MAYFSTTLEGAALFLTTIAGALGAVFAIKMIMEM
jgi:hypothetical protein